ncbi:hypothetical protein ACIRNI_04380 [Streptomyces sp. NPDC093546]|uniref:hypothetical protein n=1 Tax=Streptomyces sp. NPDC093546 TaxID=3366040 RepID=UPI0037F7AEF1
MPLTTGATAPVPAPATARATVTAPAAVTPTTAAELVRRGHGPAGHYVLSGPAMDLLRDSQRLIEPLLRAASVRRTHLPVLVPPTLVRPVRDLLRPGLRRTALTTHDSEQPTGWYATAGLCLRALPLVSKQRFSWRELPVGFWSGGPAVSPVIDTATGTDAEDLVCADGLLAGPEGPEGTGLVETVGRVLDELGVGGGAGPAPEPWALTGEALVWRHAGRVTASVTSLPTEAAKRYGACYVDAGNRLRPLNVTFFHIAQFALLRGTETAR